MTKENKIDSTDTTVDNKNVVVDDKKTKFEVTIDSNILEVVEKVPMAAAIFADHGLPCAGCAAASYEKISDIVAEFGVDGDDLVKTIIASQE